MDKNNERFKQLLNIYIINPEHYYIWASMQMAMIGIRTSTTASSHDKNFIMDKLKSVVNYN